MHPSQLAQLDRQAALHPERAGPTIAPGSTIEAEALARIDAAREEERERYADSMQARRRRQASYWKGRRGA